MEKRTGVEAEMKAIIERLCQPDDPGLSGNLVDAEGFPRTDIDIPHVRAERHRLAELHNDHKEVTEKINENIQLLHSARFYLASSSVKDSESNNQNSSVVNAVAPSSSDNIVGRDSPTAMEVNLIVSKPFAVIDEIIDSSPAAEDGLQLGDEIVQFGNVKAGDNLLEWLAAEGRSNHGHAVL